jgi:hypothetical protein
MAPPRHSACCLQAVARLGPCATLPLPSDGKLSSISDLARRRGRCRGPFAKPVRRTSCVHQFRAESEQHVPSIIVVADAETEDRTSRGDRRTFQLKERVRASDVANPHFSSQLIQRIGWALADAEEAERTVNDSAPR